MTKKILLFTLVVLASMAVKAQNEAKEVVVNYFTGSGLIMTSTPIDCSKPRSRADVVYDMSTFVGMAEPKHGLYAGDAVYGLRFCGYNTGKALKRHVKVWATATMNNLLDRNMDTTGGMTCIYDGDCTIGHGGDATTPITLLELYLSERFVYKGEGLSVGLVIESEGEVTDGEVRFGGTETSRRALLSTSDQANGELGSPNRANPSVVTFLVTSQPVTLTGKVTDQDGRPVGAEVILTGSVDKRKYTCQTKADGTYSIVIGDSNQPYMASVSAGSSYYETTEYHSFYVNGNRPKTRDFVICNELQFKPGKMSTIILPFDPDPTVGRYYRLDRIENGAVVFERETSPKAQVPYVLFPEHEYTIKVDELRDLYRTTFRAHVATEIPADHHGDYKSAELIGAYFSLDFDLATQKNDILLLDDNPCCEYIIYEDNSIAGARPGAFHAALRTYGMPKPIKCIFNGETTEVTIPTIQNHGNAATVFDLQGRHLTQKPAKGVYIQDGKKVIVR